jgi:hypothetical protein
LEEEAMKAMMCLMALLSLCSMLGGCAQSGSMRGPLMRPDSIELRRDVASTDMEIFRIARDRMSHDSVARSVMNVKDSVIPAYVWPNTVLFGIDVKDIESDLPPRPSPAFTDSCRRGTYGSSSDSVSGLDQLSLAPDSSFVILFNKVDACYSRELIVVSGFVVHNESRSATVVGIMRNPFTTFHVLAIDRSGRVVVHTSRRVN